MARKPVNTPAARSAVKGVEDRRKASEESAVESNKRMEQARPTPTQEENDLAKVGALDLDDKEDDGSGPDPIVERNMGAGSPAPNYPTRDMGSESRGPGRPKNS